MKKGTKIALLVAVIMIAAGVALCDLARSRGADIGDLLESGAFSIPSGSVNYGLRGDAGYEVCEDGALSFEAEEVWALDISWVAGSVSVEAYDGDTLQVLEESTRALSEGQRLRWQLSGQTLSVRYCANGEKNVPAKRLTVLVPNGWAREEVAVDATSAAVTFQGLSVNETLSADTTSGEVRVSGCSASNLRVDTISGDVEIRETAVRGTVQISTTSGAVSLRQTECRTLNADTTSGDVDFEGSASEIGADTTGGRVTLQLRRGGCAVEVETISGDVSAQFAQAPESFEADTVSGAVRLRFPADTGLALDYDTVSGRLSSDVLYIDMGGVPVRVNTVSGNLEVDYA